MFDLWKEGRLQPHASGEVEGRARRMSGPVGRSEAEVIEAMRPSARAHVEADLAELAAASIAPFYVYTPHMFQGTRGRILVGRDTELKTAREAMDMGFVFRSNSTAKATPEAVASDFSRVRKASRGMPASWYLPKTLVELPAADVADMRALDVAASLARLRERYAAFASFPDAAQVALAHLAYEPGRTDVARGVKCPLTDAVEAQDWTRCAAVVNSLGFLPAQASVIRGGFDEAARHREKIEASVLKAVEQAATGKMARR